MRRQLLEIEYKKKSHGCEDYVTKLDLGMFQELSKLHKTKYMKSWKHCGDHLSKIVHKVISEATQNSLNEIHEVLYNIMKAAISQKLY